MDDKEFIEKYVKPETIRKLLGKTKKNYKFEHPCYVCGKHAGVTEEHHIIPVQQLEKLMHQKERLLPNYTIWLCPNCHTYVHKAYMWYDEKMKYIDFLLLCTAGKYTHNEVEKFEEIAQTRSDLLEYINDPELERMWFYENEDCYNELSTPILKELFEEENITSKE